MKRGIVVCFIISTFFIASSIISMERSEESTIFVSKDSPPTPRKVPPISLGRPSTSLSGQNSPDTSPSLPRAHSELMTERRRDKIRKEHESEFSLIFPDGSHTTDEIPSRRKLTQEEKEKITQGVAPFSDQIEEADKALKAKLFLEDPDNAPSDSGSNDSDIEQGAREILRADSGQITPTRAALRELRDFKPEFEPETRVNPRNYDESESFSEEPEPTPKKALTKKQQEQLEEYQRETEDEKLVRLSQAETARLMQEEEVARQLQKEQEEDAARLQRQDSAPDVRQAATETTTTEPTIPETTSLPKTKPTKLHLTAWVKQHPLITVSISIVTFLALLYYLDKLPDDIIQWLMSCSPKYNPSSHHSL